MPNEIYFPEDGPEIQRTVYQATVSRCRPFICDEMMERQHERNREMSQYLEMIELATEKKAE